MVWESKAFAPCILALKFRMYLKNKRFMPLQSTAHYSPSCFCPLFVCEKYLEISPC